MPSSGFNTKYRLGARGRQAAAKHSASAILPKGPKESPTKKSGIEGCRLGNPNRSFVLVSWKWSDELRSNGANRDLEPRVSFLPRRRNGQRALAATLHLGRRGLRWVFREKAKALLPFRI
mmetsp:Transcript_19863/g.46527  ORF Transcript_19863/g.46527 Transcript_19863/m.46527 type:complete len:120 (+) Transcript_19863:637-996(+)